MNRHTLCQLLQPGAAEVSDGAADKLGKAHIDVTVECQEDGVFVYGGGKVAQIFPNGYVLWASDRILDGGAKAITDAVYSLYDSKYDWNPNA